MSSAPSRRQAHSGGTVLLNGIDWPTYTRLLRTFAERPAARLTYDRGLLEILSPLHQHESDADMLGRFVAVLSEEQNLPIKAGRSTTLRRRSKRRGLEPDCCWWIATEALVRGKRRIDLRVDPPPDLAVEVDVTSSSLDRMTIYARLGVPEVWRLDAQSLAFHLLQPDGKYAAATASRSFPAVTTADLMRFLALRATLDETTVIRQFRAWVVQQLGKPSP
jgi:Uma2 family endonuclease